jgi:hypothetical protein
MRYSLEDDFDGGVGSDPHFDAMLDEYQERERELAFEREAQGDIEARRPNAVQQEITFGELVVGDYITAEPGEAEHARYVKVIKLEPGKGDTRWGPHHTGSLKITFETPQPIGVGMENHWVLDRDPDEPVVIDASERNS